jgi:hypothetical protein
MTNGGRKKFGNNDRPKKKSETDDRWTNNSEYDNQPRKNFDNTIDGAKITNPTIDLVKISKIPTVRARNSTTSIGEIKNLIGGIRNSTSLKETLVDGGEAVKRSSK